MDFDDVQFFDSKRDYTVAWKRLPHWAQVGTVCFITWRTADSLPEEALRRFLKTRAEMLDRIGLSVKSNWHAELEKLSPDVRRRFQQAAYAEWDGQLDTGAGECVLRFPEVSLLVEKCLLHFDGIRYFLTDFAIMPNHVHLLVAFREEAMLVTQCTSWKHYTAREINRWLVANGITKSEDGAFWQVEQFDHLVRSPEQFEHFRRYIADNPIKASVPLNSYRHFSKLLK